MADDKTYDIENKEIFAVGIWNGVTITEKDLEEIEKNYYALKEQLHPPLKLGHRENLNKKNKDGEPALGWISNVKKVGQKLKASFTKLPEIVYRAIKKGGYRTVSSELFKNYTNNGKSYGKVLAGVALVGADLPAVTTLEDLADYYTENDIDIIEYTIDEGNIMEIAELQKIHDEELALAKASKEQATANLQRLEAENKRLSDRLALQEYTQKADTFKTFCEDNVKAGKLTPASRDKLVNIIDKKEFTDGNTEILFTVDDVKEIIENSAVILKPGEMGQGTGNKPNAQYTDAGAEVAKLTKEYMNEFKVDYDIALNAILTNNTELANDYINDVTVDEETE